MSRTAHCYFWFWAQLITCEALFLALNYMLYGEILFGGVFAGLLSGGASGLIAMGAADEDYQKKTR